MKTILSRWMLLFAVPALVWGSSMPAQAKNKLQKKAKKAKAQAHAKKKAKKAKAQAHAKKLQKKKALQKHKKIQAKRRKLLAKIKKHHRKMMAARRAMLKAQARYNKAKAALLQLIKGYNTTPGNLQKRGGPTRKYKQLPDKWYPPKDK